jgi:hypothetical protein
MMATTGPSRATDQAGRTPATCIRPRDHAAYRRARTRFVPGRTGSHACIMAGAAANDIPDEAAKKGAHVPLSRSRPERPIITARGDRDSLWGQKTSRSREPDVSDGPTRSGNVSIHANV